jgi:ketosteroid isomerase-like protein
MECLMSGSDAAEQKLRLDYEQTLETYRQLSDIRFKLLAFVPTLSGIAVALLSNARLLGYQKVALAGLGFLVTLGIVLYDQRNTQFYNGAITRAQRLEDQLRLGRFDTDEHRGLFGSRRDHRKRRLFALPVGHDLGLALIYSSVLGAWVLEGVQAGTCSSRAAVGAGAGVAALAFLQFEWLDGEPKQFRRRIRDRRRELDEARLKALNEEFSEAEKRRDERFFRDVLAKDLVFRRANGSRINKNEYLEALEDPQNTYDHLASHDLEVILFGKSTALVSLSVEAKGTRSGNSFEGDFRNTRLWVKQRGSWRCAIWFNSQEGAEPVEPSET